MENKDTYKQQNVGHHVGHHDGLRLPPGGGVDATDERTTVGRRSSARRAALAGASSVKVPDETDGGDDGADPGADLVDVLSGILDFVFDDDDDGYTGAENLVDVLTCNADSDIRASICSLGS